MRDPQAWHQIDNHDEDAQKVYHSWKLFYRSWSCRCAIYVSSI